MVLNNYKGGQLANRIVSFAHLMANSIEYGYTLINPEFDEFEQYFVCTHTNYFNGYAISTRLHTQYFIHQLYRRSIRFFTDITHLFFATTPWYSLYRIFKSHDSKGIEFNLNEATFIQAAKNRNVILQGWAFRDHTNFNKHANVLRSLFVPVEKYNDLVQQQMLVAKASADVVFGIHIRRGDYKQFEGGKYYFDDAVYIDKMWQLYYQQKAIGNTCCFLICTNEPIDETNFPTEFILCAQKRHFITDLYCLAACDGILGPPSSFSTWASFYGKVPIQHICTKDDVIQLHHYATIV
jgi:hypothetical protein